jgi:hypothetical protein
MIALLPIPLSGVPLDGNVDQHTCADPSREGAKDTARAFRVLGRRARGEGSLSEDLSRCTVRPMYHLMVWGSR